jgi:hypothetical protein
MVINQGDIQGQENRSIKSRQNMVDGLHILVPNRTMKPLAIALNGAGGGQGGEMVGVI